MQAPQEAILLRVFIGEADRAEDEMMESGLVTLERARVLQYGRKRTTYFKRLKESVLQHLHIQERSQPGESGPKPGHVHE